MKPGERDTTDHEQQRQRQSARHFRSVAIETCLRHAALLDIVPWGTASIAKLPNQVRVIATAKIEEVVREACAMEARIGQRTPGIEQTINAELWDTLKVFGRRPLAGSAAAAGGTP